MDPLTVQDLLTLLGERDCQIEQYRRLCGKLEASLAAKDPEVKG